MFRNAVLDLAKDHAFARPLVNSGRLSLPCTHDGSPLNDDDALAGGPARTRPGSPCPDAPLDEGQLLDQLGNHFTLLGINTNTEDLLGDLSHKVVPLSVSTKNTDYFHILE